MPDRRKRPSKRTVRKRSYSSVWMPGRYETVKDAPMDNQSGDWWGCLPAFIVLGLMLYAIWQNWPF
jgi:hypothetical protein